jgi:hypothetical protein
MKIKLDVWFSVNQAQGDSPQAISFISEMLIIDYSFSQCDVTPDSRIRVRLNRGITNINQFDINIKMLEF